MIPLDTGTDAAPAPADQHNAPYDPFGDPVQAPAQEHAPNTETIVAAIDGGRLYFLSAVVGPDVGSVGSTPEWRARKYGFHVEAERADVAVELMQLGLAVVLVADAIPFCGYVPPGNAGRLWHFVAQDLQRRIALVDDSAAMAHWADKDPPS